MDFKNDCNKFAVVVVSLLIAFMEDPVCRLKKNGVKAFIIISKSVWKENVTTDERLVEERFFFYAPEALAMLKKGDTFEQSRFIDQIVAVVIDAGHCVSKW